MSSSTKIIELNDLTKNISNILDKEFEFLKGQNIDDFLSIQDQKEKLLADLSKKIIEFDLSASLVKNQPQFDQFFANVIKWLNIDKAKKRFTIVC